MSNILRLSETYTFGIYNTPSEKINEFPFEKYMLNMKQLSYTMDTINRKLDKIPMSKSVARDMLNLSIVPFKIDKTIIDKVLVNAGIKMYLSELLAIPKVADGNLTMYVDMSGFDKIYMDKNNDLSGDINIIYTLLQNALIYKQFLLNPDKFTKSFEFIKTAALMYNRMFFKVLDKLYALKTDPLTEAQSKYLIYKFFFINMLKKPNDAATSDLCINLIGNTSVSPNVIKNIEQSADESRIYESLLQFIDGLEATFNRMKGLNIRTFIPAWTNAFGGKSLHAANHLAYLMMVSGMVRVGTSILPFYQIDTVASPYHSDLYDLIYKTM